MAASIALLPLDQSLGGSSMSERVSSARKKRRRSTKKSETQSLTKRSDGEGENGVELNSLESGSLSNWHRPGSLHTEDYRGHGVKGSNVVIENPEAVQPQAAVKRKHKLSRTLEGVVTDTARRSGASTLATVPDQIPHESDVTSAVSERRQRRSGASTLEWTTDRVLADQTPRESDLSSAVPERRHRKSRRSTLETSSSGTVSEQQPRHRKSRVPTLEGNISGAVPEGQHESPRESDMTSTLSARRRRTLRKSTLQSSVDGAPANVPERRGTTRSTPGDSIDGVTRIKSGRRRPAQQSHRSALEDSADSTGENVPQSRPRGSVLVPVSQPDSALENSVDGVAAILQTHLDHHQQEEGEREEGREEVRVRDRLVVSPPGHSSGVVTESELEEEVQARVNVAAATSGRPLPPPASSTDKLSDNASDTTDNTDILAITLHGTDELQASVYLTHPSVRVSVVSTLSGSLLKKSAPEKCVTSYYEKDNPAIDYILPVLTQPFDCRQHRVTKGTLKAQWQETLTFNEQLSYFTSNEDAIIFFELLDFVTGGSGYTRQSEQKPWYRIAWAFLRPSGKTCQSKIGERIRLQLYKYPRRIFGHSTEGNEVFALWQRHYRSTYPSTLYVTLGGVSTDQPEDTVPTPALRSLFPLQEEKGTVSVEQMMQRQLASKSYTGLASKPLLASTTLRLPGQSCQIPTSFVSTQYPTPMGCSCLAFSQSGHLLAAGCADQDSLYPIVIYEVPSFKPVIVTEGHRGIIYQVCWSEGDQLLASASADGIVRLWSPEAEDLKPLVSMPHPCYVYCVCFLTGPHYKDSHVLATGAYDGYVRIWSINEESSVQMVGEFQGHRGHINCLVWLEKTSLLYAGDSKGVLGVWHKKRGAWMLKEKIDVVNGQSLISLTLHPNGRKMLLHTQKATLVMLDLRISRVSCEYAGVQPSGLERCASLVSPCGGLVFAGTSRGTVHVWSADTGKELYVYQQLPFTCTVGALTYHPSEHMLAIASFGDCQPFVVLSHVVGSHPPAGAAAGTTSRVSSGTFLPSLGPLAREGGDQECSGLEEDAASCASVPVSSRWRDSRRLTDLVKTLDRVTAPATAKSSIVAS